MSADAIAPVIPIEEKPRANARRKSGRSRFANTCQHREAYKAETGEDWPHERCPKFAHLPGNGRGPAGTSVLRTARVLATGAVKPLFYLGLLYAAYILLSSFIGGLSFFGSGGIPVPNSGMPNGIQQQQNSDVSPGGASDAGIPPVGLARTHDSFVI